jgi:hypothetical protein
MYNQQQWFGGPFYPPFQQVGGPNNFFNGGDAQRFGPRGPMGGGGGPMVGGSGPMVGGSGPMVGGGGPMGGGSMFGGGGGPMGGGGGRMTADGRPWTEDPPHYVFPGIASCRTLAPGTAWQPGQVELPRARAVGLITPI